MDECTPHATSRRSWLKQVAGGLGVGVGIPTIESAPASRPGSDAERPRNIVFMVADGMSMGVPSLADPFSGWSAVGGPPGGRSPGVPT